MTIVIRACFVNIEILFLKQCTKAVVVHLLGKCEKVFICFIFSMSVSLNIYIK